MIELLANPKSNNAQYIVIVYTVHRYTIIAHWIPTLFRSSVGTSSLPATS